MVSEIRGLPAAATSAHGMASNHSFLEAFPA